MLSSRGLAVALLTFALGTANAATVDFEDQTERSTQFDPVPHVVESGEFTFSTFEGTFFYVTSNSNCVWRVLVSMVIDIIITPS